MVEECAQVLVNLLEDWVCLGKVSSLTDQLDMTLTVLTVL